MTQKAGLFASPARPERTDPRHAEGTVGGVHIRRRLLAEGPPTGRRGATARATPSTPTRLVDRGALIAAAAGLLFTTSATTANGTALREDRRPQLNQLIADRAEQVAASELRAANLRGQVEQQTDTLAHSDGPIKAQQDRAKGSLQSAGFTKLAGTGVTVELNDAPRRSDQTLGRQQRRPGGASERRTGGGQRALGRRSGGHVNHERPRAHHQRGTLRR
ncbi:hypothetical protein GCM10027614_48080 [Micromonospora vulcania]